MILADSIAIREGTNERARPVLADSADLRSGVGAAEGEVTKWP